MAHVFYPSGSRTYIRQVSGSNLYEFFVNTQDGMVFYLTGSNYDTASLTASYAVSASYAANSSGGEVTPIYGTASSSFNPMTDISTGSIVFWFKGSSGSYSDFQGMLPSRTHGQNVQRWNDVSPSSSHFHAHQGILTTKYNYITETGTNNTHQGILISPSSGQKLYTDARPNPIKPFWLFVVHWVHPTGSVLDVSAVFLDGSGASNRLLCTGGITHQIYAGASLIAPATASFGNGFMISSFKINGASSVIRANGVQVAAGNAGTQNSNVFVLGADYNGNSTWGAIVLEMLAYQSIADSDAENIERYLNDRYLLGLTF